MADFIVGRGVWFGFFLLLLPALFLYHELAVHQDWPLLLGSFPGLYEGPGADTIMFLGNAFVLPLGALGQGVSLLRMEGSRFFGILLIIAALGMTAAIVTMRPTLRI